MLTLNRLTERRLNPLGNAASARVKGMSYFKSCNTKGHPRAAVQTFKGQFQGRAFCSFLSFFLSFSLSLSPTRTHTHTHTQSHTLTQTLSHTNNHTCQNLPLFASLKTVASLARS